MEQRDQVLSLYFGEEANLVEAKDLDSLHSYLSEYKVFMTYFTFESRGEPPTTFYLNYGRLVRDCEDSVELAEVVGKLRTQPDYFVLLISAVLHLLFMRIVPSMPKVCVRVVKYDEVTSIGSIRSALIHKFVCVTGTVIRVTAKQPYVLSMDFSCLKCTQTTRHSLVENKYTCPPSCAHEGCSNSRLFKPVRTSDKSVNWRRIKIQEQSSEEQSGVPLTIECEAKDLDIQNVSVGDPVTVMGIVRAESTDLHRVKHSGLFGLFIEITSLVASKSHSCQIEHLTPSETQQIHDIAQLPNLFYVFIKSFGRIIYGHEKVKAGLLLALFGGNDRVGRGSAHVLIVGDPGLGKTQLIRTASAYSNRGVYVSATTKAGLTINLARENGQHMMRAGALVMADEGVCAIDEFDKMGKEQEAMLEVMEQQTITVAKAGIYCTLRAKATVLAASNPVNGHYNPYKSLKDNLKVSAAILSRFDLIFLLCDQYTAEVSKHVMDIHSGVKRSYKQAFHETERLDLLQGESFASYARRVCNAVTECIPDSFFKKYIAFAKANVHPVLSPAASEVLNAFYVQLRSEVPCGSLSVTARQLHSLKRLTEARARIELREIATEADAIEVVRLYRDTIFDTHFKTREVKQRPQPLSAAKQHAAFVDRLHELGQEEFTYRQLQQIQQDLGLGIRDFSLFVDKLNQASVLLKRPGGMYKLA